MLRARSARASGLSSCAGASVVEQDAAQQVPVLARELEEAAGGLQRDVDRVLAVLEGAGRADRLVDRVVDHREAVGEHGADEALQVGEVVVDELAADAGGFGEADDRQAVDAFAARDPGGDLEQLAPCAPPSAGTARRSGAGGPWRGARHRLGAGRHADDLRGGR